MILGSMDRVEAGILLHSQVSPFSFMIQSKKNSWVRRRFGWVPISLPSQPKLREKNMLGLQEQGAFIVSLLSTLDYPPAVKINFIQHSSLIPATAPVRYTPRAVTMCSFHTKHVLHSCITILSPWPSVYHVHFVQKDRQLLASISSKSNLILKVPC